MIIIVMGVSGSGKTTVGRLLAEKLDIPFYDADNFHPLDNIKKMKAGIPLSDMDREPWLQHLNNKLGEWSKDKGAVLACSALKEAYRKQLNKGIEGILWIYLSGSADLIAYRMKSRMGHYMPPELLQSQFADLEEPSYGIKAAIDKDPETIVQNILDEL
ncbi:MAG: gluconokinase [Candidatus Cyclobacteriaceae bacterium M2_1C_046]